MGINQYGFDTRNYNQEAVQALAFAVLLRHMVESTGAEPARRHGSRSEYRFPYKADAVLSVITTDDVVTWFGFKNEE